MNPSLVFHTWVYQTGGVLIKAPTVTACDHNNCWEESRARCKWKLFITTCAQFSQCGTFNCKVFPFDADAKLLNFVTMAEVFHWSTIISFSYVVYARLKGLVSRMFIGAWWKFIVHEKTSLALACFAPSLHWEWKKFKLKFIRKPKQHVCEARSWCEHPFKVKLFLLWNSCEKSSLRRGKIKDVVELKNSEVISVRSNVTSNSRWKNFQIEAILRHTRF